MRTQYADAIARLTDCQAKPAGAVVDNAVVDNAVVDTAYCRYSDVGITAVWLTFFSVCLSKEILL